MRIRFARPQHERIFLRRDLIHQLELPKQTWKKTEGLAFLPSSFNRYDDSLLRSKSKAKHRVGKVTRVPERFDDEIHRIERTPMAGGAMVGFAVFVVGLVALEGGSLGDRVPYLFASAVGTAIFWWGLFGLFTLAVVRLGELPAGSSAGEAVSED